jgi:hypothetical protein
MRATLLLAVLLSAKAIANQAPPAPSLSPDELVRKVVNHELQEENQDHSHWMYQVVTNSPAPSKTSIVVETKNGNVTYLDSIDGRPLSPRQRTEENRRVGRFISDPAEQRKARTADAADAKKSADMFSMLPDAFLFKVAGTKGDNVRLSFTPNPNFTSHSKEAYIFHKMDGFVIVNTKANELVEISGHLTHAVEFVGGLLGHLDTGGVFDVQREEVSPGHWFITRLKVDMNGKALIFKTIAVQQDEVHSHFQPIPDSTTLPQAEALAQKQSVAATPGSPAA